MDQPPTAAAPGHFRTAGHCGSTPPQPSSTSSKEEAPHLPLIQGLTRTSTDSNSHSNSSNSNGSSPPDVHTSRTTPHSLNVVPVDAHEQPVGDSSATPVAALRWGEARQEGESSPEQEGDGEAHGDDVDASPSPTPTEARVLSKSALMHVDMTGLEEEYLFLMHQQAVHGLFCQLDSEQQQWQQQQEEEGGEGNDTTAPIPSRSLLEEFNNGDYSRHHHSITHTSQTNVHSFDRANKRGRVGHHHYCSKLGRMLKTLFLWLVVSWLCYTVHYPIGETSSFYLLEPSKLVVVCPTEATADDYHSLRPTPTAPPYATDEFPHNDYTTSYIVVDEEAVSVSMDVDDGTIAWSPEATTATTADDSSTSTSLAFMNARKDREGFADVEVEEKKKRCEPKFTGSSTSWNLFYFGFRWAKSLPSFLRS